MLVHLQSSIIFIETRPMKKFIYLSLTLIVASAFTYKQTLPSIKLKNTEGETVDVSSYAKNGKITVISFWATWCGPCIKELDAINDLYEDWQEDYNMEVVAVSIDDSRNTSKVKPLAAGRGWDYDILLDVNQKLKLAMNVANPPTTFLVDTSGNIVYTHSSYKPGDEDELEEKLKELTKDEDAEQEAAEENDDDEQEDSVEEEGSDSTTGSEETTDEEETPKKKKKKEKKKKD
jgi:cytochrome c biogenesis protein CcmG/thiol:disulfide interchange protein DsbE